MAFPTIPTTGAGTLLSNIESVAGTTHTFPSLSSLTKSAGDLLIAIVLTYDGNTSNAEFSGWGGSFTEILDFASTVTLSIGVAYKFSTGSETGTFTVTSSGAARAGTFLMAIPGAHATTPPEAGGAQVGSNSVANPAAFNPAGWDIEDTLWIAVAGVGEDATTGTFDAITAAPASYTNLSAPIPPDDVIGSMRVAVAFRGNAVASEDPGTFTNDTSNTRWGACTIAVRPATAATPKSDGDTGTGADAEVSLATALTDPDVGAVVDDGTISVQISDGDSAVAVDVEVSIDPIVEAIIYQATAARRR